MNELPAKRGLKRALVQRSGDGTFLPEMKLAFDELTRAGWAVSTFIPKHLERRRVALTRDTLMVADVPLFESALRQLGIEPPQENCYPPELSDFLHRRVWPSTMKALEASFLGTSGFEVFAKPRGRIKRFTGRMLDVPTCNGMRTDARWVRGTGRPAPRGRHTVWSPCSGPARTSCRCPECTCSLQRYRRS